jgi:hypothetical protein
VDGKGTVTLRLTELNPHAAEALIETLRDALPADGDRVRLLIDLWEALTGD